jgi:hypothetical protein
MEDVEGKVGDLSRSLVAAAIKDRVEEEKCVVAQYRTSAKQKNTFVQHLSTCKKTSIPIEWVIDIADESNGWFYGTAYHYDDTTQMLHVMVPDRENPTFDGHVLLDHRTVHLIECADGKSDALFNKIIRDSVVKVKWDVEWFEESEDGQGESESWAADGTTGSWINSSARYYIRIANQLLVEDKDLGQESRGFVIITADLNLKLLKCHKGKGMDDFQRLINEGVVQSTPEAAEVARSALTPTGTPTHAGGAKLTAAALDSAAGKGHGLSSSAELLSSPSAGNGLTSAAKLADMSTGLRECVVDILDDRDRMKQENQQLAEMFETFTLQGDLDAGLKLMAHYDQVRTKAEKMREAQTNDTPVDDEDKIEAIADDAIYLAQKLERNLGKIVKAGGEVSSSTQEEIESLRRSLRKARSDLDAKEEEVRQLRSSKA